MHLRLLLMLLCPILVVAQEAPQAAPNAKAAEAAAKPAAEANKPDAPTPGKRQLTLEEIKKFFEDEKGRITTEWCPLGTSSRLWDVFTKAGYVPVLNECKLEDGELLFRKGFKHVEDAFPGAAKLRCYCRTGESAESFEERDADLTKKGYTLMKKESCIDENGGTCVCALWVNPTPAPVVAK